MSARMCFPLFAATLALFFTLVNLEFFFFFFNLFINLFWAALGLSLDARAPEHMDSEDSGIQAVY